ncbi:Integral membrane protein SYS1-related protein [Penicillium cf. griseofulvum]|uniref:Integral membrane protein SYS1-related protein n=1 Tax=Penicillium cf. griseofulvum TaxID=2972120 RepID=A0A9W9J2W4_9EURO|nr:Integral membrane protein SYS1-related protein [Penicillium cf. griseofulvum]KAJ5434535.1 Integral membrane protein SYS1-related protein [Penicillium cf. griseofulvum]KAJ5452366.1 Integral membrane protein SYS1-related protein [Penicillium cf. griseofulvum]
MPARRRPPARSRTELPPLKIVRKILLLQLAYYACATVLILFTTVVYGAPFSLDLVFGWDSLRGDTTIGWMLGLVWMLNCFVSVIFLLIFVSRSKLVPDFALTIHFLHLIATTLYSHSLPSNILWWGLQFASAAMMTFLGMWVCQRRELEPIKFGGHGGSTQAGPSQASDGDGQQESSFGRGRGRERSLQEYELDDMKHTGEHTV